MTHTQKGSALIEFAGSLIVLTVVFTGVFQIGYGLYTYERLENAVRAGARYASTRGGTADQVATAARNLVVYGDPAPAAEAHPVLPGLSPENVTVVANGETAAVSIRGFEVDSIFAKWKLDGRPLVAFPIAQRASQ